MPDSQFQASMLATRASIKQRLANIPPPVRRNVAPWRIWTALFTAITFAFLVSTAAMHHHATAADDQDCAVCSVVAHKLAELPLAATPKLVVILISYAPFLLAKSTVVLVSQVRLPPSCGPPHGILTIC